MHPRILDITKTALVVVDIQEAFRSAINDFSIIASRASMAVRGFQILGLPVIITEQYPQGLGRTGEEILFSLPAEFEFIQKTSFGAGAADGFLDRLRADNIGQVVLCGLETHICVSQTAHDLLANDIDVHLLTDAVSSRFTHDREAGLAKMAQSGAISSSIEMALFELLGDAKHEKFKEIQNLIK